MQADFFGNKFYSKAFTIAEVLITLSIIGIVASMTIPNVIANYQKHVYVTKLKKFYSQFNQALTQLSADNGCVGDLRCTGIFTHKDGLQENKLLGDELVKYFKIIKNCGVATSSTAQCWPLVEYTYYDGRESDISQLNSSNGYKFITADGASVHIHNHGSSADSVVGCWYSLSTNVTGNMSQMCADVVVDVNGLKGPNRYGRDTYFFWVTNGKGPLLYPRGGKDDNYYHWWGSTDPNKCSAPDPSGEYCAARIMEESWEMNY